MRSDRLPFIDAFGQNLMMALVVALIALLAAGPAPAVAADSEHRLLGASSGRHLWFVVRHEKTERDGTEVISYHLIHHGSELSSRDKPVGYQRKLGRRPAAMAAWEDRVWLAFAPESEAEAEAEAERRAAGGRWEIFTLRVLPHPEIGAYTFAPRDRLSIVPPLPDKLELLGLVGAPDGPVAMVTGPRLLQLVGGSWRDLPIPDGLPVSPRYWLGPPSRATRGGLTIFTTGFGLQSPSYRQTVDGAWEPMQLGLDPAEIIGLTRAGDHLMAVRRSRGVAAEVKLDYLRRAQVLPLARLPIPVSPWVILGMDDGLQLMTVSRGEDPDGPPAQAALIQRIDMVNGEPGPILTLRPPPSPVEQVLPLSALLAIAVTGALLALVFRSSGRGAVTLPENLRPASIGSRGVAIAIDLVPGAVLAILVLDAAPSDLLATPLFTPRLADAAAFLVMIAITTVHGAIGEVFFRRSLGKAIVGAEVVSCDGGRPSIPRLLLRNLARLMVLVLPPLALLAFMNPNLQGIHDLLAGTVVVEENEEATDGGPADDLKG